MTKQEKIEWDEMKSAMRELFEQNQSLLKERESVEPEHSTTMPYLTAYWKKPSVLSLDIKDICMVGGYRTSTKSKTRSDHWVYKSETETEPRNNRPNAFLTLNVKSPSGKTLVAHVDILELQD